MDLEVHFNIVIKDKKIKLSLEKEWMETNPILKEENKKGLNKIKNQKSK